MSMKVIHVVKVEWDGIDASFCAAHDMSAFVIELRETVKNFLARSISEGCRAIDQYELDKLEGGDADFCNDTISAIRETCDDMKASYDSIDAMSDAQFFAEIESLSANCILSYELKTLIVCDDCENVYYCEKISSFVTNVRFASLTEHERTNAIKIPVRFSEREFSPVRS